MSDTDQDSTDNNGDDPIVYSGEYVLGVLDAEERAAAEARMETDPAFAALVWHWADRLAALADGVAPVTPPERLRRELMASLFSDAPAAEPAGRRAGPAGDAAPGATLWQSLAFWRGAAIALGLAALVFLTMLIGQGPRVSAPAGTLGTQSLIASLQPPSVESILTVEIDPVTGMAIIDAAALDTQDLYTELWVIPEGGEAVSMGVFPADGQSRIALPDGVMELIEAGVALAVTLEPEGGAPNGVATGPVIAIGQLKAF